MKTINALCLILLPPIALVVSSIHAKEPQISLGMTDRQHVEINITQLTDPAGHACCVQLPPSLIELYLIDGELALDAAISEDPPAWFSFGPMAIDDNFEFSGQSTATVAGFSGVQSTVTGTVEDGFISAKFQIGIGGRLPTGASISWDARLEPGSGGGLYIHQPVSTLFGLADVLTPVYFSQPRGISEDQPIDLALAMDPGGETGEADWWLVLVNGDDFFSFDITTLEFTAGLRPTYQGPLVDVLEPVQVLNQFNPPFNDEFTIVWGTDRVQNGTLDVDSFRGNAFDYYFYD